MDGTDEEKIVCCNCGCDIADGEQQEYDDEIYCEDCFVELYSYCDECDQYFSVDDVIHVESTDRYVCDNCLAKNYFRCGDCREYRPNDECIYVEGEEIDICRGCYDDHYFTCDGCAQVFNREYYGEDGYCQSCCEDRESDNGLHDYGYKPKPIFYGSGDLFFGIELEAESNGSDIDDVVEKLPDFVYAKFDGSLDNGLEIVSHPASWEWLMENKDKWNDILKIRDKGFTSYNTDTCGIHVHLTKDAFSSLHLYKFLKLFYEHPSFILLLSRRRKHNLDRYASLESDESIIYKAKNKSNGKTSRYTAVNLGCYQTVEVRIFRGTLAETGFWRNIEFCKAAYDFTKEAGYKNITEPDFCSYVIKNQKIFPNLYKFLVDKGCLANLFVTGECKNVYDNLQDEECDIDAE